MYFNSFERYSIFVAHSHYIICLFNIIFLFVTEHDYDLISILVGNLINTISACTVSIYR